jgi:hypothetical protein
VRWCELRFERCWGRLGAVVRDASREVLEAPGLGAEPWAERKCVGRWQWLDDNRM